MPTEQKTMSLPTQYVRAMIRPETAVAEGRTVDLVFSTGARVERFDWFTGRTYYEQLSMEDGAVDLTRMQSGAPLLDTHNSCELGSVLGVVEDARVENGEGRCRVRFAETPDVEIIWQKVRAGIIRNVSVGYEVEEYTITETKGAPDELLATRWTPVEVSLVPVGADAGAGIRARDPQARHFRCALVRAGGVNQKEKSMSDTETKTEDVDDKKTVQDVETAADTPQDDKVEEKKAELDSDPVKEERQRAQDIRTRGKALGIPETTVDEFVTMGVTLDAATRRMFDLAAERSLAVKVGSGSGAAPGQRSGTASDDTSLPIEKRAEAEYDRSPELQAEFRSKAGYIAYRKAEERGQIRTSKTKS